MEGGGVYEGDGNLSGGSGFLQGRWPREETLTLLEIRTRLHPKFRQAAAEHKAPLWDEVSRIMAEEYGYQRSAKKCKEKLDNLYKYYKKTKGAKRGSCRNNHYRFFKQLEALYGQNKTVDHITTTNNVADNIAPEMPCLQAIGGSINQEASLAHELLASNANEFDHPMSSDDDEEEEEEEKVRHWIEMLVRRLMQVQESWYMKMLEATERIEQRRILREEAWQKQNLARREQEERLWAYERAWMEARDRALMNALQKVSCKYRSDSKQMPLLMPEYEEESKSMRTCSDHEEKEILLPSNDEINDLFRLQNLTQPDLDQYSEKLWFA